jgi:hypothetical protein
MGIVPSIAKRFRDLDIGQSDYSAMFASSACGEGIE